MIQNDVNISNECHTDTTYFQLNLILERLFQIRNITYSQFNKILEIIIFQKYKQIVDFTLMNSRDHLMM